MSHTKSGEISAATIKEAQKLLDELRGFPQYSRYVEEHKLALVDSRLSVYDEMLNAEYLVPVCKEHGLANSAFTHMVPAVAGYFEELKSQCARTGCGEQAVQFICWQAGL